MTVDALLSTIILVAFLVTIIMAIASYLVYKFREGRRPRQERATSGGESLFFERIDADELRSFRAGERGDS